MKTPKGCEWKTVIGRPVLIRKKDGVICGGKVPRSWHGKRLQDRPWEGAQYRLTQEKRRSVSQFIKENKDAFYYGRKKFKPIMIAESIDGRVRIYIEFIRSTPRIVVMERKKGGFFEEKPDHPYNRKSPTNEVKKVLMELGY